MTFEIPEAARRRYRDLIFCYPPGSGRYSTWSHAEIVEFLEPMLAKADALPPGPDRTAIARELETLHDLKHEFDVNLSHNDEGEAEASPSPSDTEEP